MTSVDAIDSALRFIPANERETWVKVGMALKAELGNSGYSLWDYWSQSSANYEERAAQLVWRSFKSGGTKVGTLFHIAMQHGYKSEKKAPVRVIPEKKPPPPQKSTGKYAIEIWLKADCSDKAVTSHPYAVGKGIESAGGAGRAIVSGRVVGRDADCIVIPIRSLKTNKLVAVQCVNVDGDKQTFGPVSGNALLLGNTLDKNADWFVAEGWASSYSMVFHHYHGNACCATAFGKSNLDTVATQMADTYQPDRIYILREQDK